MTVAKSPMEGLQGLQWGSNAFLPFFSYNQSVPCISFLTPIQTYMAYPKHISCLGKSLCASSKLTLVYVLNILFSIKITDSCAPQETVQIKKSAYWFLQVHEGSQVTTEHLKDYGEAEGSLTRVRELASIPTLSMRKNQLSCWFSSSYSSLDK